MTAKLYWNDGRPVLDCGGKVKVFPPCVLRENWLVWCRRYGIRFDGGLVPSGAPAVVPSKLHLKSTRRASTGVVAARERQLGPVSGVDSATTASPGPSLAACNPVAKQLP